MSMNSNSNPNMQNDLSNRVVAGYRVLHRLGRGGMSEVYLAFHEKLRRHIAPESPPPRSRSQ